MPIPFPTNRTEIANRQRNDVQSALPTSNPFLRESALDALIVGSAGRAFDIYQVMQLILQEMFPDTATGTFLDRWGSYKGIVRSPASAAVGNITVTGTAATIVPASTQFQNSTGDSYLSTAGATLGVVNLIVASLTRSGTLVTVVTSSNHNLASNLSITISGADQTDYNGSFTIIVTSETEFTYNIATTPVTPATGTIIASFTGASIILEAEDTGQSSNQTSGAPIDVSTPIAGLDGTGYVQFSEISGGEDVESDDAYRERVLYAYRNPVSLFNVAAIENLVLAVPGVTRVFVETITPAVGQVTVYFTKDNDQNQIPTAQDRDFVHEEIVEIAPVNTAPADIFVPPIVPVTADFTFTALVPNSTEAQQAVLDSLTVFFRESNVVGQDIKELDYQCVIRNTIDPLSGNNIEDFVLTSPVGDIIVNDGELAVLGTVTFP